MDTLFESAIRATFIAAATALVLRVVRVTAPAALHSVWSAVTVVMLLMPAVVVWIPKAAIPLLDVDTTGIPLLHRPVDPSPSSALSAPNHEQPPATRSSWPWLAVVYTAGVLVFAVRIAVGLWHTRRLVRAADAIDGRLTHPGCVTPMTVGVLKPTVVLPPTWPEWSPADRAAVLDHEQEHVRRHDPLMLLIALINRAVFWFHPLAWWLHRQIARLAEEACDAAVLSRGHDARAYAESLLRFATRTAAARGRWTPLSLQMLGQGVATRVSRILDNDRRPTPSRMRLAATALLCGAAVAVCSAAVPSSQDTAAGVGVRSQGIVVVTQQDPTGDRAQTRVWRASASDHFDVFSRQVSPAQVDEASRIAELAYQRVSSDFRHELADRVPLILVARQGDVPPNPDDATAMRELLLPGLRLGGVDHIILGVDVLLARPDQVVHELTHVFLFDIIPDASRSLPWLSEGLAEYERGTWNASDLADVRQTAAAGRIPAVDTLVDDDRQWGHAVADFISAEFGQDGIRRYLAALRNQPQVDAASEAAFNIPLSEFNRRFVAHVMRTLSAR